MPGFVSWGVGLQRLHSVASVVQSIDLTRRIANFRNKQRSERVRVQRFQCGRMRFQFWHQQLVSIRKLSENDLRDLAVYTPLGSADNTVGQEAKMRTRATIRVLSLLLAAPCFAGDLEDGVRLYDQKRYAPSITAFEKAAVGGNAEAQRRLGFMYYHGEGVAQNNQRAVTLFETSASAGDILSASNLGMMYENGMGVDQDDARAASWYRKAAELGDSRSQFTTKHSDINNAAYLIYTETS